MAVISHGDRDRARELLDDLITTPIMADEARAAFCGNTSQAVGALFAPTP